MRCIHRPPDRTSSGESSAPLATPPGARRRRLRRRRATERLDIPPFIKESFQEQQLCVRGALNELNGRLRPNHLLSSQRTAAATPPERHASIKVLRIASRTLLCAFRRALVEFHFSRFVSLCVSCLALVMSRAGVAPHSEGSPFMGLLNRSLQALPAAFTWQCAR